MGNDQRRPLCLIVPRYGRAGLDVAVRDCLQEGVQAAGMEPVEWDAVDDGSYEALVVAENVVADITEADPGVVCALCSRQTAGGRNTVLVCAGPRTTPKGVLVYRRPLKRDPVFVARIAAALRDPYPSFEALRGVVAETPGRVAHSKTDDFLAALPETGKWGPEIAAAIRLEETDEAVKRLDEIEAELSGEHFYRGLLGVYLGYREKRAYGRMTALFERMPALLRATAVAREQYALALNRLAEEAAGRGENERARELRMRALAALDEIPAEGVTSETHGIRGRIYKGWQDSGVEKAETETMLGRAIEACEQGFRADMRDTYPGVNAVTLRFLRGSEEDRTALRALLPAVRFAANTAPAPRNHDENYWQHATMLELAVVGQDWEEAEARLKELLGIPAAEWLRETTRANLARLAPAFAGNARAGEELRKIVRALGSEAPKVTGMRS